MDRLAKLILMLIAFTSACGSRVVPPPQLMASPRPPPSFEVDVTLAQPQAGRWVVSYALKTPTDAVRFRREYPHRKSRWRIGARSSVELRSADDGHAEIVRRTDGKPISAFHIEIDTYAKKPEKAYQLFVPFTDGGVLLYTGYFDVELLACGSGAGCEPRDMVERGPVETRFTLLPRPSEHVIVAGETHRAPAHWRSVDRGTYVYFGATAPVSSPHMTAVVDRGFPPWLLKRIEEALPRLFALYTLRTGHPLTFRPNVYLSYGPPAESRGALSIGGGTLPPGILQQDVTLGLDRRGEGDAEVLWRTLFSVAHEAAHLWNGEQFFHEVPGGGWLHEGSADAFAYRALVELGFIDKKMYRKHLSDAASLCAFGLAGAPLKNARPGSNDYTCGFLIAALSEAAARRRDPRGDIFSFWGMLLSKASGRRYDDILYLQTLESVGGAELATMVRRIVNEPLEPAGQVIAAALRASGATLRTGEPAPSDEYRRIIDRTLLEAPSRAALPAQPEYLTVDAWPPLDK
ncbi:MAG TPA: hypothetical protein VK550_30045 [Polyangiaceae bacterium]|nr:hypothetical protein [Polyangiaceae bacterium]